MEESLQVFAGDPLVAEPGTKFHYSTYGYTVLGCVLEDAASKKYADYVKENVFEPAGMAETQADNFFAVVPHRSRWYHKDKSGVVENAGVLDSSYKTLGGGLISSADDMARFEIAIMANKLLEPATREVMWTPLKAADGSQNSYALGWGNSKKFGRSREATFGSVKMRDEDDHWWNGCFDVLAQSLKPPAHWDDGLRAAEDVNKNV